MRSVEGSTLMKSIRTRMSLEHVVLTDPQHLGREQIAVQFDNEISNYHWAINVVENAYTLKSYIPEGYIRDSRRQNNSRMTKERIWDN